MELLGKKSILLLLSLLLLNLFVAVRAEDDDDFNMDNSDDSTRRRDDDVEKDRSNNLKNNYERADNDLNNQLSNDSTSNNNNNSPTNSTYNNTNYNNDNNNNNNSNNRYNRYDNSNRLNNRSDRGIRNNASYRNDNNINYPRDNRQANYTSNYDDGGIDLNLRNPRTGLSYKTTQNISKYPSCTQNVLLDYRQLLRNPTIRLQFFRDLYQMKQSNEVDGCSDGTVDIGFKERRVLLRDPYFRKHVEFLMKKKPIGAVIRGPVAMNNDVGGNNAVIAPPGTRILTINRQQNNLSSISS